MKNTLSDRLNYLTTIAEEQSITRAATRLFISQPALTAFLSRTEEELGTRLLCPRRHGSGDTPCAAFLGSNRTNAERAPAYFPRLFQGRGTGCGGVQYPRTRQARAAFQGLVLPRQHGICRRPFQAGCPLWSGAVFAGLCQLHQGQLCVRTL